MRSMSRSAPHTRMAGRKSSCGIEDGRRPMVSPLDIRPSLLSWPFPAASRASVAAPEGGSDHEPGAREVAIYKRLIGRGPVANERDESLRGRVVVHRDSW